MTPSIDDDDFPSSPPGEPTIGDVIQARLNRRGALAGIAATAGAMALGWTTTGRGASPSTLGFAELPRVYDRTHHVAAGYRADVLIRWGDRVLADAPAFAPTGQTASSQRRQFGYNNDFIGYLPLPVGSTASDHGLLCVNHEYTSAAHMFPDPKTKTRQRAETEMAAHGHSVIEIRKAGAGWHLVQPGRYNRRINALDTEMRISGPAAGHARLRTSADPSGRKCIGTLGNCGGGITPWGTVMIAEENFQLYFTGDPKATREALNNARLGFRARNKRYGWSKFHARFDLAKEPNEPNRFGWMVELDPYDPTSIPVKRTALGRFKHESATTIVNKDRRVVVYSGDDQKFDYVYKFVSTGRFDPDDRASNRDLMDDGTLFTARFDADGTLTWMPLAWGTGPLTPANGFASQADVLIETRRAADLLGATPMDRPEDVEPNPVTGKVYVMLTNNAQRKPGTEDAANPRARNRHGHILELIPPGGRGHAADHAADTFRWELALACGNPAERADKASYHPGTSPTGWLSAPDNCAFDNRGRLWIATDGGPKSGIADGLWAMDTEGPGRALTRHFFAAPRGAELCGPAFTPDGRTLFCAVQHPAAENGSTFDDPTTRWPDFQSGVPPRPSVVAITKTDGGIIGG